MNDQSTFAKKLAIGLGVILLALAVAFVVVMVMEGQKADNNDSQTNGEQHGMEDIPYTFGETVTIEGQLTCLPHRDQSGPQTLECAIGLETDDDMYFGLTDTREKFNANSVSVGAHVRVTGVFEKRDPEGRYAVVGTVAVAELIDIREEDNAVSTEGWTTYTHEDPNFALLYPSDWHNGKETLGGVAWSNLSGKEGVMLFKGQTSADYLPGTNFRNAWVSVGRSNDAEALESCLDPEEQQSPRIESTQVVIQGTQFTRLHFVGAGAGSRYDTMSYRIKRDGYCYAVESVMAYSAIGMYGPDSDIQKFDHARIERVLDTIVGSFYFSST